MSKRRKNPKIDKKEVLKRLRKPIAPPAVAHESKRRKAERDAAKELEKLKRDTE